MNMQQLKIHEQDLHKIKPDKNPVMYQRGTHEIPLAGKLWQFMVAREKIVSFPRGETPKKLCSPYCSRQSYILSHTGSMKQTQWIQQQKKKQVGRGAVDGRRIRGIDLIKMYYIHIQNSEKKIFKNLKSRNKIKFQRKAFSSLAEAQYSQSFLLTVFY